MLCIATLIPLKPSSSQQRGNFKKKKFGVAWKEYSKESIFCQKIKIEKPVFRQKRKKKGVFASSEAKNF